MSRIYVIGHVNPDTNSIAAAMGYAWLLRERDGRMRCGARRRNQPSNRLGVKTLGLDAPLLLTDASPRFDSVTRRLDTRLRRPPPGSVVDLEPHRGHRSHRKPRRREAVGINYRIEFV